MISHSQGSFQRDSAGSYRPTQASGFHGWERPNIAGGLSCTAWRSPCFWLLHIGGFRLYTLRRAQPLSMCRHTGAGHSCHRFRLHDRRLASYSSQRLDALAIWCSVFPPSFAARGVRPLMPRIVGWCSTGGILHTEGVAADAPTPPTLREGGKGGGKKVGARRHTPPHSHFRIYHALRFPHEGITATFSVK